MSEEAESEELYSSPVFLGVSATFSLGLVERWKDHRWWELNLSAPGYGLVLHGDVQAEPDNAEEALVRLRDEIDELLKAIDAARPDSAAAREGEG